MTTKNSRTILEMTNEEATAFLTKKDSYFTLNLPEYFDLTELLTESRDIMSSNASDTYVNANNLNARITGYEKRDDMNYTIYVSKDGRYSWRPMTIINPFLYLDLVDYITKEEDITDEIGNGWDFVLKRFKEFHSNEKIECASIPRESLSDRTDTGENIMNWWEQFEQKTIEKSLDFKYCLFTDISNFYPSIYTHSIPWAFYGKEEVKSNLGRYRNSYGQGIDTRIQKLQYNQTNGIPQGSVLMDFISEIILGYIDLELTDLLNQDNIEDYHIIRYRDDYRIFSNSENNIELIAKYLQQILLTFNLNLGSGKTYFADNIVNDAVKHDKRYWEPYRTLIRTSYLSFDSKYHKGKITLQKHLLQIHTLSQEYPNSGMIKKALTEFYEERNSELEDLPNDYNILISILVDIMYNNPNSISYCIIIIAKLLEDASIEIGREVINKILRKYKYKANTDYIEIWLQRLAIMFYENESEELNKIFSSNIYHKVLNKSQSIFPSSWLNPKYRKIYDEPSIVNQEVLEKMRVKVDDSEISDLNEGYIF